MSAESSMRQRVVKALKPLHAVSIENSVASGTPDVSYVHGWIELKSRKEWPKRASTSVKIRKFTPEQRQWLRRRWNAGGAAYLLLKIAQDWLLIRGDEAHLVGNLKKEELFELAVWYGSGPQNGLQEFLESEQNL